jgi:serine/threonine protein phosphatase 1
MPAERTIAIGDVHGCDVALERLLSMVSPAAEDTVIQLGDVCDRGPDTRRTIDLLIDLAGQCDFKLILGNHDEMMLGVFGRHAKCDLAFWWGVGGSETIESYGGDPDRVPDEHLDFLAAGLPHLETASEIFIHATLEENIPLHEQDADCLRWRKVDGSEPPHPSGKRIICGHTSQRSGVPLVWDGWVCIDTKAFDEAGWLTALEVGADLVYQANQRGEIRGPFPLSQFANSY